MDDNERHNAIRSSISHKESRLAELDKERQRILDELKSHISIEMQTIIGIISLYDKRQAKNRVDQAVE